MDSQLDLFAIDVKQEEPQKTMGFCIKELHTGRSGEVIEEFNNVYENVAYYKVSGSDRPLYFRVEDCEIIKSLS